MNYFTRGKNSSSTLHHKYLGGSADSPSKTIKLVFCQAPHPSLRIGMASFSSKLYGAAAMGRHAELEELIRKGHSFTDAEP